tara:strand:- start:6896 stop:7474 length:579 start_codon:yes stop_codon:yes gene_type:complete
MKHVKLFEQFLINENASYKKLVSFIKSIKTYMDIYDGYHGEEIMLQTRENGDVGYEEAGSEDVAEAERIQKLIKKKFPNLRVEIEEVDEWVHLNIRKPEEPKFRYVFIKKDDDGAGFSEGFDSMKDLIKKYKTWIDGLNWKKITKEAEAINQFPNNKFNGWLRSNDMLISKEGSKGNKWGYSFYIAKEKSKV